MFFTVNKKWGSKIHNELFWMWYKVEQWQHLCLSMLVCVHACAHIYVYTHICRECTCCVQKLHVWSGHALWLRSVMTMLVLCAVECSGESQSCREPWGWGWAEDKESCLFRGQKVPPSEWSLQQCRGLGCVSGEQLVQVVRQRCLCLTGPSASCFRVQPGAASHYM